MLNKNEVIKELTNEEFIVRNAVYEYVCKLHLYDDKYSIVDNFYMIYRKDNTNENIEKIKEFVLSEKGQKIIEDTGYVSVNGY